MLLLNAIYGYSNLAFLKPKLQKPDTNIRIYNFFNSNIVFSRLTPTKTDMNEEARLNVCVMNFHILVNDFSFS